MFQSNKILEKETFDIVNVSHFNMKTGWFVAEGMQGESVVGEAIIAPMGKITVDGNWDTSNPKFGRQFKVKHVYYDDLHEIIHILLATGFLTGIKRSKTEEMVKTIGVRLFEVLDACLNSNGQLMEWNGMFKIPEDILMSVKGVGPVVYKQIVESWKERGTLAAVSILAIRAAITAKQFRQALFELGVNTLKECILENPYDLTDVESFTWEDADRIAALRWDGKKEVAFDSPQRAAAAMREAIKKHVFEGHTCMNLDEAIRKAGILSRLIKIEDKIDWPTSKMKKIEDVDGYQFVTTTKWYNTEKELADKILMVARGTGFKKQIDLNINWSNFCAFELGDEQKKAVMMALTNNVSIITGGPGTGKSTILNTILNILDMNGVKYALCAPTGIAKSRIEEITDREAHTIHKYFETYLDDAGPFWPDYLFVDEMSMVPSELFQKALRGLEKHHRIVLIGDIHQLPPIGPGDPLRQMIESGLPTVRLETIYRQGKRSGIVAAAHAILHGETPKNADDFLIVRENEFGVPSRTVKAINWLMESKGFNFDDIQVLTPINKGPCGRTEMSKMLQDTFNPGAPIVKGVPFRIYDRVIQSKNMYDIDTMNGEVGKVVAMPAAMQDMDGGGEMSWGDNGDDVSDSVSFIPKNTTVAQVEFKKKFVSYDSSHVEALQLAFSFTIHKSQGNEFPAVIVLMPFTAENFYLRQLPYTAITRAAKFCIVISVGQALEKYVTSTLQLSRQCMLSYFIDKG